jgi:hypothetical protein
MDVKDYDLIIEPLKWLNWPYLPMKKQKVGALIDCGFIIAGSKSGKALCTVIKSNFHTMPFLYEDFEALPKIVYPDIKAMLDDGWEIDRYGE